jgi:signal transduction histidine kinase
LGRDKPEVSEAQAMLQQIVNNGARAADVIRGLRALAKKAAPERTMFDLNEAISEVLAITRTELLRASIKLDTTAMQGQLLVNGDRVQLQQVVLNLLMNAVEAISSVDRDQRKIIVSTELSNVQAIMVTVEDNGEGMAPETIAKVFEPFVTTKKSGMGMGLSICKTIVESHSGELTVTSTYGHGATFRFWIPRGDPASVEPT